MWGWLGGGGNVFLAFMLFPTFQETKHSGNKIKYIIYFQYCVFAFYEQFFGGGGGGLHTDIDMSPRVGTGGGVSF